MSFAPDKPLDTANVCVCARVRSCVRASARDDAFFYVLGRIGSDTAGLVVFDKFFRGLGDDYFA